MKSKHVILTLVGLTAGLSLLILNGCYDPQQTISQIQDSSPEVYQQNISNDHLAQRGSVHQISSLEAREIAVNFVGYGDAYDVTAFTDRDTLIFEVDVRSDSVQYVVLLNAENGNVTSLSRHEFEHTVVDFSSGSDTALDEYIPQTTSETVQSTVTPPVNPPVNQPVNPPVIQSVNPLENPPVNPPANPPVNPPVTPPANPPANPPVNTPANERGNRPSNPAISLERAIEIANADLTSRGISATYHSHSGMDWERGQWVWELLYKTHGVGGRMILPEFGRDFFPKVGKENFS